MIINIPYNNPESIKTITQIPRNLVFYYYSINIPIPILNP